MYVAPSLGKPEGVLSEAKEPLRDDADNEDTRDPGAGEL